LQRDLTILASLAVSTNRIKLATGILAIYYRSPALNAMTAATLDELSGGRLILGLGSGAPRFLAAQGIDSKRKLDAMREYIEITRRILSGDSVQHEGRFHNLTGVKLSFKPPREKIPIYLAARRERMLQLAGQSADGVFVSDGFCSESYIRWAGEKVRRGLKEAGRNSGDVDFSCAVLLSVAPNSDEAKEYVKPAVFLIVLAITLICSLGAIHCYTLATKRLLSEAGMRGMIFGALLLVFSLGLVGSFSPASTTTFLAEVSAFLVLVGGVICFVLRHTTLSSSPIMRQ
jgi:alkanesulfonate monooxygenase SsuD/methylene tetrahydromethanopterin reductase-like flavin-dependent oxidoreductase (luciferase family)